MTGSGAERSCRQHSIVSGAQLSTVMLHPVFVASRLWEDGGGHTSRGQSQGFGLTFEGLSCHPSFTVNGQFLLPPTCPFARHTGDASAQRYSLNGI